MMQKTYVRITDRVKAAVADALVLMIFMLIATDILGLFDKVPDLTREMIFIFVFFLYDPIFVSVFGGTIGHMIFGIGVRRENDTTKKIIFPLAVIRFFVKLFLGWLSLLTISTNKKGKTIHDLLVKSIVIYKNK